MYRLASEEGQELTVRHARSLTRYSESHLHSHVLAKPMEKAMYRKETILSIFSIFLVDNLCWTVFIPIFPAFFRPQYGFISVGFLFSIKPMTQLLTTSIAMTAVDNFGPKTPQLVGTILLTLAILLASVGFLMKNIFTFEHLFLILLAMRAIHGSGSALLQAGGLSHVAMCHSSFLQGYAVMIVRFGAVVGLFLGPPLGGWMVHTHGDLSSERHENNDLWILFVLLLCLSSVCCLYQLVFFHNGHSIYVSDDVDLEHGTHHDILSRFSDTVSINLQTNEHPYRLDCSGGRGSVDGISHDASLGKSDGGCFNRWSGVMTSLENPSIIVTICAGMCGGIAVGTLELLLPTFFYEEFQYNPFHQSLFYILVPVGYWFFSMCTSYYADYGTRHKALTAGLWLLSGGFLLFLGVAKSAVLVGITLFYIGGCLGVVEMSILPLFYSLLKWLDLLDVVDAFELSECSLLLGLAVGPVMSGGVAMTASGGIWGFQMATFVVGSIGVLTGAGVAWVLPGTGRVAGEAGLDLDGSLFGIDALRGMKGECRGSGDGGHYRPVKTGGIGSFGSDQSSLNSGETDAYMLRSSLLAERDGNF